MGTSAALVEQVIHPVEKEQKLELLSYLIGSKNYHKVLVFVRKKFEADVVAKELNLSGLKTAVIHGDKTTGARSRALEDFKEEKVRVLVATDIAARGLDIPGMGLVINYDIPHVTGDFIHRIGRTGRAGVAGKAITLLSPHEEAALKDVEKLMRKVIKREVIEGYEVLVPIGAKGAKKQSKEKKKTDGAFGKRQKHSASAPTKKKRKVTKRDGFKQLDRDNARKK
jgi:ATP-dependent RNA helicase RhlE